MLGSPILQFDNWFCFNVTSFALLKGSETPLLGSKIKTLAIDQFSQIELTLSKRFKHKLKSFKGIYVFFQICIWSFFQKISQLFSVSSRSLLFSNCQLGMFFLPKFHLNSFKPIYVAKWIAVNYFYFTYFLYKSLYKSISITSLSMRDDNDKTSLKK